MKYKIDKKLRIGSVFIAINNEHKWFKFKSKIIGKCKDTGSFISKETFYVNKTGMFGVNFKNGKTILLYNIEVIKNIKLKKRRYKNK